MCIRDRYKPPFEITSKIIELISNISGKIGEINYLQNTPYHMQLRKENWIKTIHSSLAIENNSLSLKQITAIIEGKHVLGNPNEIKEVKNSIRAYDLLLSLKPYNEKDLLKAHRLMMQDLVDRNGKYRTDGVGIFDGEKVVHLAPSADRVPELCLICSNGKKKAMHIRLLKAVFLIPNLKLFTHFKTKMAEWGVCGRL